MNGDARLMPVAAGLWVSEAGITLSAGRAGWWTSGLAAVIVVVAAAVLVVALARPWPARPVLLVLACSLVVGASLAALRVVPLAADPLADMTEHHAYVTVEVVVGSSPKLKDAAMTMANSPDTKLWRASAELVSVTEAGRRWVLDVPVRVSGRTTEVAAMALVPGATIRSAAVLRAPMPGQSSAAEVSLRGKFTQIESAPVWQRVGHHIRASMRAACVGLPWQSGGLLPGLVVGDDSGLSEEARSDMKLVGMSHLTAVSGSNLAIVTGVVLLLARGLRLPRRAAVTVAALALAGFVAVVGPEPSVLRAAAMGVIALVALFTGRRRSGLTALTASVVVLLLIDPWLASSVGFVLSVCATAGLLGYAIRSRSGPVDDEVPQTRAERTRRACRDALGVTLAAQVATAPVVAGLGSGLPIVGIPANLLAEVAVPPATVVGAAAALVASVAPVPGHLLAMLAGYPAGWILVVAQWAADVPGGVLPWPSGVVGTVLMVVLLIGGYCGWRYLRTHHRSSSPKLAVSMAVVAALVWAIRPTLPGGPWPAPGWLAVVCDVGQGDGTVIATTAGHAIVVDVGPESGPINRCLTDLGVSVVDLLILTHFHVDHVEGLPGLLSGRTVGR
ncbi:MAG: ComEC/Rec2 family competence protein, partial [Actinomycetes bacterium]